MRASPAGGMSAHLVLSERLDPLSPGSLIRAAFCRTSTKEILQILDDGFSARELAGRLLPALTRLRHSATLGRLRLESRDQVSQLSIVANLSFDLLIEIVGRLLQAAQVNVELQNLAQTAKQSKRRARIG